MRAFVLIVVLATSTACQCGTGLQVVEPDASGTRLDAAADARRPDTAAAPDTATHADRAGTTDATTAADRTGAVDAADRPDAVGTADTGQLDRTAALDRSASSDHGSAVDRALPTGSEVLLFDGTGLQFSYDDNGFLPLIRPGDALPMSNWSAPIDYYNGEFQVRYVVSAPAGQGPGRLQTCIWTMGDADGDGRDYFPESCSSQPGFAGVGEFYNDNLVPSAWWKLEDVPLDFAHPERFMIRAVLRGPSGCNVTRYSVADACWDQWPSYENMVFRITIVMVGAGDSFSGWSNYP